MFFVNRDFVCQKLGISTTSSYRLLPTNDIAWLNSDTVIYTLNKAARGHESELNFIPSDIITPEQAEQEFGIPAHKLLIWTRRKKKVPPHYRLTKQLTRFRRASLASWLERKCA